MNSLTDQQRTRSRQLRRAQTDAEKHLWTYLRSRQLAGAKFRRQLPVGQYVVDFCCLEVGLVLELDGGQHAQRGQADEKRTRYLEQEGLHVLRFWNDDVLQSTEDVLEQISRAIEQRRSEGRRYGR